jgi:predicted ATPase
VSLARLWQEQGRGGDARNALAEVCAWFEGRKETLDLIEARALIDALAGVHS